MKFYECNNILQYSWDQVARAIWLRYPNPESSHVLTEDTICRKIDGNKLYSKRLLTKTNRLPKWGERFVNTRNVSIVEESIVDPTAKEVCTYTRNVGLTKVLSLIEKVTYRPCPYNNQWTVVERRAWVDSRIFGFRYAIQTFGVDRYRKNVIRANNGFEYVLKQLFPIFKSLPALSDGPHEHEIHRTSLKDAARETAKRAKEIAQETTRPVYVSYES